jgi:hypothetical protein
MTEVSPMTDKKHKSYAEKNEERILNVVDNLNEKGEKKQEEKKKEAESEIYTESES